MGELVSIRPNTKQSESNPIACPKVGKISAAKTLNKNITEIDWATSLSSASITGAVAAIAEPPHIDEPTPMSVEILLSIFRSFIIIKATISDVEIVATVTGRHLALTETIVTKLSEKPRMITAYCKNFFDVNLMPVESLSDMAKLGFIKVTIIPIRITNTGAPIISNEKLLSFKLENTVAIAAIIINVSIPNPFLKKRHNITSLQLFRN